MDFLSTGRKGSKQASKQESNDGLEGKEENEGGKEEQRNKKKQRNEGREEERKEYVCM